MEATPLSVLIVDDDPTMSAVLRGLVRRMEGLSCTTESVDTGAAARSRLNEGRYDLMLLDYQLPDEDGLAILSVVAAMPEMQRPIVIMLTGAGSERIAVEAMKRGARDYLLKGVLTLPALERAILAAVAHRRLERQLAETNEQVRRHHAQLEADLAMAREVQQALLPQAHPRFPARPTPGAPGLQICHRWQPSHKVAGDYLAVIPLSDTRAGVFQCDVMGHGMRAALVTALVHGLLRENRDEANEPAAFLRALNRQLHTLLARVGDVIFATAVYAMADATTGKVVIANAGHPAPLHVRRSAGAVTSVTPPDGVDPALGLIAETVYGSHCLQLAPGDTLLLLTDGVHEVPGAADEDFGPVRLVEAVRSRLAQPTEHMLDGLIDEVLAFRGLAEGTPLPDDVCLVAVDYREPSA